MTIAMTVLGDAGQVLARGDVVVTAASGALYAHDFGVTMPVVCAGTVTSVYAHIRELDLSAQCTMLAGPVDVKVGHTLTLDFGGRPVVQMTAVEPR